MYTDSLIFSQVMEHLPMHTFRRCVQRYRGNHKIKSFSCVDQYRCMAFAQLTYRESLRDIEVCLRAQQSKLYHMGIRGGMSRNTLSNANKTRDWRIYADFAQALILSPATSTWTTTLVSNSTTPSTHSMQQPSICVCPYFPGPTFAVPRALSNYTP